MSGVFPASNLPDRAAAWGRAVQSRIVLREQVQSENRSVLDNGIRAFSGQLAVSASQIEELYSRSTEIVQVPDISRSGSASTDPFPSSSETVSFSARSGTRRALLTLDGVASNSTTAFTNTGDRMAIVVEQDGSTVMQDLVQINLPTSTPPAWENSASVSIRTSLVIPGGTSPVFTVSVYRVGGYYIQQVSPFAELPSPASTVTLSNLQLVLDRSGGA